MQSTSSMIWTRVTVPISDDDNHYTTGISIFEKSNVIQPSKILGISVVSL